MEKIKRIIIDNISKEFMIGSNDNIGALARFLSMFSGKEPKRSIHALKSLSFDVYSGEIVGIIGDNGSGKSTLLRTVAGIYHPDGGKVTTKGKIISLINLTVGLKERLTMKENIFLVGSLFGMSQKEIKKEFNNIVEFSELKEFVNTKIYQFSSGMMQRLAFSIAAHAMPDILLLDEVFEVGDEIFKKKSAGKIKDLVSRGACVISVSHDLDLIKKYCDRIIWLEEGIIKKSGLPGQIIQEYIK
jgi:ABC-type polysaccharide/polyol phosphate transport system ATPase subunit